MKIIPLIRGQVAFVSDHRFEELNQWRWQAHASHSSLGGFYAQRHSGGKFISIHQQITGIKGGDHRNCNPLNNCDYNLRPATRSQNLGNQRKRVGCSSQYKGVCFHRGSQNWQARIRVNHRLIHLGRFEVEEDAARAYDAAALKYFGEFARLNFPVELPLDCEDARQVALYLATKHDGPNGARDGQPKLTRTQVSLIRLCGVAGMAQRDIAERFPVQRTSICRILGGKRWKETPEAQEYLAIMFGAIA